MAGRRNAGARGGWAALLAGALAAVILPSSALAQSAGQFGRADRANAASQLITLAVQQTISQLPPTAGQSFTYGFDPKSDTFVRSERQGPTALLSPRNIGEGNFALRLGVSYFRLSETFDPVFYRVPADGMAGEQFTQFGLDMSADSTVVDLGATYGITDWLDVFLDLPIVIVDAEAEQTFLAAPGGPVVFTSSRGRFEQQIGLFEFQRQSLAERGTFSSGTNVGVGRIGLGARTPFYATSDLELGLVTRFAFASPTPDKFSGSGSYAIYPCLVGEFFTQAPAQLFVDVGYEYDFSVAELRRFAWQVGGSMAFERGSFDLGVGGSVYDTPVRWTPDVAFGDPFEDDRGLATEGTTLLLDNPGENVVDTDVVNLLLGGKIRLTDHVVLSGSVLVALTSGGVRPDAVGTLSIEVYL